LGAGLKPYPVKKKIVEKPPRNSVGFCGGGQGLSWAVEPRKEEEDRELNTKALTSRQQDRRRGKLMKRVVTVYAHLQWRSGIILTS
jgi:hypothetical protein